MSAYWGKKLNVMNHYDVVARAYDLQYGQEQRAKIEFILRNLDLEYTGLVLDVGCGTGLLFDYLLEKAKILVGVDISRNILRKVREKFKGKDNIFLIQADADYLPFPEETFDLTFAITLLQNVPSPAETMKEMRRVTKTGASIIVTGLKKGFGLEDFKLILKGFLLRKLWNEPYLKDYIAFLLNSS